jgi:hypothetical protein
MNDRLRSALNKLRLSGLSESLEVRLHEAASHNLNHACAKMNLGKGDEM